MRMALAGGPTGLPREGAAHAAPFVLEGDRPQREVLVARADLEGGGLRPDEGAEEIARRAEGAVPRRLAQPPREGRSEPAEVFPQELRARRAAGLDVPGLAARARPGLLEGEVVEELAFDGEVVRTLPAGDDLQPVGAVEGGEIGDRVGLKEAPLEPPEGLVRGRRSLEGVPERLDEFLLERGGVPPLEPAAGAADGIGERGLRERPRGPLGRLPELGPAHLRLRPGTRVPEQRGGGPPEGAAGEEVVAGSVEVSGHGRLPSDGVQVLGGSHVDGLLDLRAEELLPVLAERDHGVVVELELPVGPLRLPDLRARLDLVAEDDPVGLPEELEDGEELPVRAEVRLEGGPDPGAEHLDEVIARDPARGDVVAVGLRSELRVERERDLWHLDEVVDRVAPVLLPLAVLPDPDEPLEPDLADARRHAPGLRRPALGVGVAPLQAREAGDALLRDPRRAPVHRLLVRAGLDALAIAAAALLVDQHDPVLGTLVDRLARTGGETGGVGAVVADPGEIEEPGPVDRQRFPLAVEGAGDAARTDRDVLVQVGRVPVLVGGEVAERHLRALGRAGARGLEDGLAVVQAVRPPLVRPGAPPADPFRVRLVEHLEEPRIPLARIAPVGLGLDVRPPHRLLALSEGPGRLARHRAGLAAEAAVGVEDEGELALGVRPRVGVLHRAPELPVEDLSHRPLIGRRAGREPLPRARVRARPPRRDGGGSRGPRRRTASGRSPSRAPRRSRAARTPRRGRARSPPRRPRRRERGPRPRRARADPPDRTRPSASHDSRRPKPPSR